MRKQVVDPEDLGDFQYVALEREALKRAQRRELERLMSDFLDRGGVIQRVTIRDAQEPRWRYLNRAQRKTQEGEE